MLVPTADRFCVKMSDGEQVYHQPIIILCIDICKHGVFFWCTFGCSTIFIFVFDILTIAFSCVHPEICDAWESKILVHI